MAMIKMAGKGQGGEIAHSLDQAMLSHAVSCELVAQSFQDLGGATVIIRGYDKYYMRSGNRAGLTVVITTQGENVLVTAISSGGGGGALFRFDWGAENNFVGVVQKLLTQRGFTAVS